VGLYAALKAPLFHGSAGFCGVSDFPARVKDKINVKGSGQECPLHTSKVKSRGVPQRLKPRLKSGTTIAAVNRCATQNQEQSATQK
jgi:hypothetical protein